jgi:hypothetical protein
MCQILIVICQVVSCSQIETTNRYATLVMGEVFYCYEISWLVSLLYLIETAVQL